MLKVRVVEIILGGVWVKPNAYSITDDNQIEYWEHQGRSGSLNVEWRWVDE